MSFLTDDAYSEYREYVEKFKRDKIGSSELAEAINIIERLEIELVAGINATIQMLEENGQQVNTTAQQLYDSSPMAKIVSDFKKKVGAL